jgi:hypothetical protein
MDPKSKKEAEEKRLEGNKKIGAGKYQEAIDFYTQSIKFDSTESAAICNRALAYLKLK